MPYRISKDYDESATHLLTELQRGRAEQVLEAGNWQWRAQTACGRTITGVMGWSAFNEAITCKQCKTIMRREDNE